MRIFITAESGTGVGRKAGRMGTALGLVPAFTAALALCLAGCAGLGRMEDAGPSDETPFEQARSPESGAPAGPNPAKRFEEPGELDKLLDAKPIALAPVKSASVGTGGPASAKGLEPASAGKGKFRLQIGAESDVDAAQAKKLEYDRLLGGSVDVVFDPPYYKLRWGFFDTKGEAEDKLLELTDHKIQGFVIKQ